MYGFLFFEGGKGKKGDTVNSTMFRFDLVAGWKMWVRFFELGG